MEKKGKKGRREEGQREEGGKEERKKEKSKLSIMEKCRNEIFKYVWPIVLLLFSDKCRAQNFIICLINKCIY